MREGWIRSDEKISEKAVSTLKVERVPISVGVVLSVVLSGYVIRSFQEQYTAHLSIKQMSK